MGGEPTIEALFRADFARLVRALAVSDGVEEAADAVQDAFVEANGRWGRVAHLEDPGGWVRRVALNRLADQRRTSRRRAGILAGVRPPDPAQLDEPDLDLLAQVRALPPQQRRAICLHHLAGYSVDDVAAMLGVASGTVKSNLHDARASLRDRLEATDG